MPDYTPPPENLDHLNPIQRYMQKGSLDREDWIRLGLVVAVYFIARPYISKAFEWWFKEKDLSEGQAIQKEYQDKRAQAKIAPNAIRGGEKSGVTLDSSTSTTTVAATSGSSAGKAGGAVNRKTKVSFANEQAAGEEKTEEDRLLDWDDEPARPTLDGASGDKADVVAWIDRWANEEP